MSRNFLVKAAPTSLELQLDSESSTIWEINNIAPGESGNMTLSLHNGGTVTGFVTIWISDIIDREGENPESETGDKSDPGELSQYLLFEVIAPRLSTKVEMPARLGIFPHALDDDSHITISQLAPENTIEVVWKWQLPSGTGNVVQGDSVLFTVNYSLEEMPIVGGPSASVGAGGGGGGGSSPPTRTPVLFESTTVGKGTPLTQLLTISSDGTLLESYTITALSGQLIVILDKGTRLVTLNGEVPERIEATEAIEVPPLPTGIILVSPVYEISAYVTQEARALFFSQPVKLVLSYFPEIVNKNTVEVFAAFYDEQAGWTKLEPGNNSISKEGQVTTLVSHFTRFAVLARVMPTTLSETTPQVSQPVQSAPVIRTPEPVHFQIDSIMIAPDNVILGDIISVHIQVTNTGRLSAEQVLVLKINDLYIDEKIMTLGPGQNSILTFIVTPRKEGSYQIDVNGKTRLFTVDAPIATPSLTPPSRPTTVSSWLLTVIIAALSIIGLVFWLILSRMRS